MPASASTLEESLTDPQQLKVWLWPQQFKFTSSAQGSTDWSATHHSTEKFSQGEFFESWLGPLKIRHQVEQISPSGIRFLLSGAIDGFHEWQWGDGWVQSRLEGVSWLPLNLAQTASLLRLKQYLQR